MEKHIPKIKNNPNKRSKPAWFNSEVLKQIKKKYNRLQRVKVGTGYSDQEGVLSGIPQSSIPGPVLFTVFINDLLDSLHSICKIFEDDTKLYNNVQNKKSKCSYDSH